MAQTSEQFFTAYPARLTLHGIQVQDVGAPVTGLKIQPRVTHNDEAPVQVTMNGYQKEVLAEDVHTLHKQPLSTQPSEHYLTAGSAAAEHMFPETERETETQQQTGARFGLPWSRTSPVGDSSEQVSTL